MERKVKAIMEIYNGVETFVKLEGGRSKSFDINVRAFQSLVLSSLLFPVVMDEITKNGREGIQKEFSCVDDLVLLGDSWSVVEERNGKWKNALKDKSLKLNVSKAKAFHTEQRTIFL